jgi:hypothetical protein
VSDLQQCLPDWGSPTLTDRFGRIGLDVRDIRLLLQRVDPKDGLTLRQAMFHYDETGSAEELARLIEAGDALPCQTNALAQVAGMRNALRPAVSNALRGRSWLEAVSSVERRDALRNTLQLQLIKKLCSGVLVATGYSMNDLPDEPARPILKDRWRYLVPDFQRSTARGSDFTIDGILVFTPKLLHPVPPKSRARFSKAEAARWYQGWVERCEEAAHIPRPAEESEMAEQELGVSIPRDYMRELRRKFAPEHWKLPGRRRKT